MVEAWSVLAGDLKAEGRSESPCLWGLTYSKATEIFQT